MQRREREEDNVIKGKGSDDPFAGLEKAKPVDLPKPDITKINNALRGAAPQAIQTKVTVEASEKNAINLAANTGRPDLGPEWVRQDMTSLFVPYNFKEMYLKPADIPTLGLVHAARVNRSYSLLVDALDKCCTEDIRVLTPEDFIFLMHWVRDNTLPKSAMRVPHKTRYGNDIEVNIRRSELHIKELDMTPAEYAEWNAKGICFPTVRDAEIIDRNNEAVDQSTMWQLEYAQYIIYEQDPDEAPYANYVEKKLAKLTSLGPGIIDEIEEFKTLSRHGISQSIRVKDPKFRPEVAIARFKSEAIKHVNTLNRIPPEDYEDSAALIIQLNMQIAAYNNEIRIIQDELDAGKIPQAREEVVPVEITAADFFPRLRS